MESIVSWNKFVTKMNQKNIKVYIFFYFYQSWKRKMYLYIHIYEHIYTSRLSRIMKSWRSKFKNKFLTSQIYVDCHEIVAIDLESPGCIKVFLASFSTWPLVTPNNLDISGLSRSKSRKRSIKLQTISSCFDRIY